MRDNRASEGYERVPNGVGNEVLLHFIWRYRYFNHRELTTEGGEPLLIHHPGELNTDQGPDFSNARITIGDTLLEGPVELHGKSSDWLRHKHSGDPHYQKVILHVVWLNDIAIPPDGIPVLALHDRVSNLLLPRYQQFMTARSYVPCAPLLSADMAANLSTPGAAIPWPAFRQFLLLQRLQTRTRFIRSLLDEHRPHWEEVIFQLVARSLGQPVNGDAFLAIAQSIPLSYLLRRRTDPARLEALFLDQATRLDPPLSFFRMRPAHHPHIRLKQLAGILNLHTGWFTTLLESDHPPALLDTLDVKGLGIQTKHSILINAFIPFLYAYGTLRQESQKCAKSLRWLEQTAPENNTVIRRWRQLGLPAASAADTQALLELRKNYCSEKKCLDCAIGRHLLTTPSPANENQS
ncbi:MAG TPA: DUF2851 family protein [Puia sp.]|nr:DUF2851 family protein [Puia sp.]